MESVCFAAVFEVASSARHRDDESAAQQCDIVIMLATLRNCVPRQLDRLLRADGHVTAQITVPITRQLILLYDKATLSPDQCYDRVGYDVSGWVSGRRTFSQQSSGDGSDGNGKKAGKIKDKKQADPASSDAAGKLAAKDRKSSAAKSGHAEERSITEIILDESGEIVKEVEDLTELERITNVAGYDRSTVRRTLQEMTANLVEAEKDMQELEKGITNLESQAETATKLATAGSNKYGLAVFMSTSIHCILASHATRLSVPYYEVSPHDTCSVTGRPGGVS